MVRLAAQSEIIDCRRCPRLVSYREEVARTKVRRYRVWVYWGRPVPSRRPDLPRELQRPERVRGVVALGMVAFKTYLAARKQLGWMNPAPLPPFGHGLAAPLADGVTIISSYHPSQQNTQTGKLTETMLDAVFRNARHILDGP